MTQSDEFTDTLGRSLHHLGVVAQPGQLMSLSDHFGLLLEANRHVNLTRKTAPAEAAVWLYADSAAALRWALERGWSIESALDIGTGAGFPAVPLAVLAPTWRVTALEATGKKAAFVEQAARRLGMNNLRAVHAHSQHWVCDATFDLVTCKALGSVTACLTAGRSYLAPGGCLAVYKTASISPQELRQGRNAAQRFGLQVLSPFEYELPVPGGEARLQLHLFARPSNGRASPKQ